MSSLIVTAQEGLTLRQMTSVEDDEEYLNLQNANLSHFAEFGNSIYDNVEEVTQSRLEKNRVRFGIRKDDVLIGMEGYTPSHDGDSAEVGIHLAEDEQGHGYATVALKALTAHMEPKFERIYAEVMLENQKSIRLCERTGYAISDEVLRDWGRAVVLDYTK